MHRTQINEQLIGRDGVLTLPKKSLNDSENGLLIQPLMAGIFGDYTHPFFYVGIIPYASAPQIYKKLRETEKVLKGEAKVFPFGNNKIQLHEELPGREYTNRVSILYNSHAQIAEIWLANKWEIYQNEEKELESILKEGIALI